jgi:hypothetical protein
MKFNKMKMIVLAVMAFTVTACSMSPEEIALKNKELEVYAQAIAKPTFTCTSGCEYTDPRRNISLAKSTNGWDFANTLVKTTANVALTAVPYAALGVVAVEGIKNSGGNTYNDGSLNTTTETVSGIKANGNVDQSQHNQNNPETSTITNTDNNSVNDSNNGGNDNSSTETKEPVTEPANDTE